jgi:hypothetical protein
MFEMTRATAIGLTILLFVGVYYVSYGQQEPYIDPVDEVDVCLIEKVPYGAPLSISEAQAGQYNYTLINAPDGIEVWGDCN